MTVPHRNPSSCNRRVARSAGAMADAHAHHPDRRHRPRRRRAVVARRRRRRLGRRGWSTTPTSTSNPAPTGTVVDDGEARDVRIDHVEPHERVTFTWWPQDRPEQASHRRARRRSRRHGSRCTSPRRYAVAGVPSAIRRGTCAALAARGSQALAASACEPSRPPAARRAVRRARRPDPARRARAPRPRRPADGDGARRALPDDAPGDRQAPPGARRRRPRRRRARPAARSATSPRPSAWPTPSPGCSTPAAAGTAASPPPRRPDRRSCGPDDRARRSARWGQRSSQARPRGERR